MKVLLVDDSGTMRHIQKKFLAELGITDIVEAADGFEALGEVARQSPDLIFMGWHLPNLSGLQALKKLKGNPSHRHIPVIMVNSSSEKSQILSAAQAGAAGYMLKPFNAETLREKLAPFMEKTTQAEPGPE